jgi:protein-tyrosine-phosphatase
MFKKSKGSDKVKILLVDEFNDLQSQVAEYFINEMYGDIYDVHSAGPKFDCVNCELVSVMYQIGYDIRARRAKDFRDKKIPGKLDYIIFLEKATYDRIKDVIPWDAPQILQDFGRKDNFEEATDDVELLECFKAFIEKVRVWVEETFADPEKLKSMVI